MQPCLWTKPAAGPGRVLVRVVAAGVNPVDGKVRAGQIFPFAPFTRLPKIPGGVCKLWRSFDTKLAANALGVCEQRLLRGIGLGLLLA